MNSLRKKRQLPAKAGPKDTYASWSAYLVGSREGRAPVRPGNDPPLRSDAKWWWDVAVPRHGGKHKLGQRVTANYRVALNRISTAHIRRVPFDLFDHTRKSRRSVGICDSAAAASQIFVASASSAKASPIALACMPEGNRRPSSRLLRCERETPAKLARSARERLRLIRWRRNRSGNSELDIPAS